MSQERIAMNWVDIHSGSHVLAGRMYEPARTAKRIVVIHPATGIIQHYYESFARWLAHEHDAAVLTYDYHDFGLNRRGKPIQSSRVSMADWGIIDQDAALTFACKTHADLPVWVIGHSLGGLMLRWHKQRARVERFITVAAGPINIKDHPAYFQPAARWHWYLAGPLLTACLGYLPGKLSGLGAELPARVYWQWRRWCTTTGFYAGEIGNTIPAPPTPVLMTALTAIAIADDAMVPPVAVKRIDTLYKGVEIEHKVLKPSDYGLSKVGHYRAFSKRSAAMWPAIIG